MNLPNIKEARKRSEKEVLVKRDEYRVPLEMKKQGVGKYYCIYTYGCQMNVHDSENIKAIMEEMGYSLLEEMDEADVIILNTCAIRENAHNKVHGMLGRIKHLKETKEGVITVFCGCMAQEEGIALELKEKFPWVDIVMGTHNFHKLPFYLENTLKTKKQEMEVFSVEGDVIEGIPVKRDSRYKAWINIMYGCDKFCTYCIVPYTRGRQRSRLPEDILREVNDLVSDGYLEVTLLGQNVNAYGKDLNLGYGMADLLRDVAKTGIERVRFVTSHPWDFTDEMIEVIALNKNIMPYIHLPLQSGSTRILEKMGRKYTRDEYRRLFYKIKEMIPNVAITTDIIVGFPGETEEDFMETLDLVDELKYDLAYTFIYSKREGTPASCFEDDTSEEVKKERLQRLNEKINQYARENNEKYLGKVVKVLVEGESDKPGKLMGYTDTIKLVNIDNKKDVIGKIIDVKITEAKTWSLDGEVVDGE